MTIEEFGKQIKNKYPQYSDLPDSDLGQKMLSKYPQYQELLNQNNASEKTDTFLTGHSILRGISDFLGLTGLAKGASQAIFLNFTKEGKDIQKMMEEGKITPDEYDKILGGGLATGGEVAGSGIKTATTILGMGKPATTALGRIGVGAGIGAGYGAGSAIEQEKPIGGVAKQTATGAIIGAGVSGLFEGVSALLRKISGSNYIQTKTGKTYTKELQPPKKEVAKDIANGFKTFGREVAGIVDDNGKPIYVGTYNTLIKKAKDEISTQVPKLENLIKSVPPQTITKNQVAGDIITQMENNYGQLSSAQLKQIQFEINRMPQKMDLMGLLKTKRMYDNLIPDGFWSKIGDPAISFPNLIKYTLRDNARKLINQLSNNPEIQAINNRISTAMNVKELAASQEAIRHLWKVSAGGGVVNKILGKIIDDYILNPAITLRTAQGLRNMGTKVGQTPLRQATRLGIIKESTK